MTKPYIISSHINNRYILVDLFDSVEFEMESNELLDGFIANLWHDPHLYD